MNEKGGFMRNDYVIFLVRLDVILNESEESRFRNEIGHSGKRYFAVLSMTTPR